MHGIHRLRPFGHFLALAIALIASASTVLAQAPQRGNYNYREHQSKDYYFGITVGLNTSSYRLFYSDEFVGENDVLGVNVNREPGLDLKIVSNLKVGEYIDVRFLPGLAFAGRFHRLHLGELDVAATQNFKCIRGIPRASPLQIGTVEGHPRLRARRRQVQLRRGLGLQNRRR